MLNKLWLQYVLTNFMAKNSYHIRVKFVIICTQGNVVRPLICGPLTIIEMTIKYTLYPCVTSSA